MLTRAQKEEQVDDLREKFGRATGVIVADYRGLSVQQVNALRRRLREDPSAGYEYRVTKNTLLRRAAEGSDVAGMVDHFRGPTALALSYGDPVGLAKILVDFARDNQAFEIQAGVFDGRPVERAEIETLATLPSLDELRAMLVGLLQAPARKILGVVTAPGAQLARLVEARRGRLEESAGA